MRTIDAPYSVQLTPNHSSGGTTTALATWDAALGMDPDSQIALSIPDELRPAPGTPPAVDRYEVVGRLGRGGMGEVLRVHDQRLGRMLAMKVLRRDIAERTRARNRFIEEARTTASLQHPGIVPIYEVGRLEDGRLYFTMPVLSGISLQRAIRGHTLQNGQPLGLRRKVVALLAAANAVHFAHSQGVLHRDLKPSHIQVGDHGEVTVIDWGLSRAFQRHEATAGPTIDLRQVAGTPAYMAPEQARGERIALRPTADIYALGACLYQVLSGRPPYLGKRAEVVQMLLRRSPPALSARFGTPVPPDLRAICERAMSRDPQARHPTARAFAEALEFWLDGVRPLEASAMVHHRLDLRPGLAH